jgi:hypothetical protein
MGLGSGIRDPGSGKNLFRIPDPGVKKAPIPDPGSATLIIGSDGDPGCLFRIPDPNFFHPGSEFFPPRIRNFSIPDPR